MKLLTHLFLLLSMSSFAQEKQNLPKVDWNGYTQLRISSNFGDNTSFMLRRMKFWIKSTPDFSEHWSYKIQTTITSLQQQKFFLQDIKLGYKTNLFSFDIGQFVPQYSLQRLQADFDITSIERAIVINALIPNGTMGVRDLGVQVNFHTKNSLIETHIGAFNGYGIKEYRFENQGYLFSHKTAINFPLPKNKLQIGYSLMYRNAQDLYIKNVLPDTLLYTGKDIRYNFFTLFNSKYFDLQAEYLNADFDDGMNADGYYFLSAINIKKSQFVLSFENYKNTSTKIYNPYYRLAYNYLINKNKTKVFIDNYFQIIDSKIKNYYASVQLQMFFK